MDSGASYDIFVIGGGINGAAIARDAAGRGLRTGLAERGDFGGATSSASTKLLHGGLRYLEFGAFGLVRKALSERAILFDAAPPLAHPLSFVIPRMRDARPDWLIRLALFLYDHLGDRGGMPKSETVRLRQDRAGRGLEPGIFKGWRYSDGWIDDARMVIALLRDAALRGADLYPRTAVVSAAHDGNAWTIALAGGRTVTARHLVNATGPWAEETARDTMQLPDAPQLRLVQGSHIIVARPTSAEDALVVQQPDKRIVFLVPIDEGHLMIGTTERLLDQPPATASPASDEIIYLLMAANRVLAKPLGVNDIVHTTAGTRPLIAQKGRNARETTRDWRLAEHAGGAAITVIGGKITTHRLLAEAVLQRVEPRTKPWTHDARLPGCDFEPREGERNRDAFTRWLEALPRRFPDYDPAIVRRFGLRFGRDAEAMLNAGIGREIGGMFEAELRHFVLNEWATTADDILWRRTKAGLAVTDADKGEIDRWISRFTASAAGRG